VPWEPGLALRVTLLAAATGREEEVTTLLGDLLAGGATLHESGTLRAAVPGRPDDPGP
jgi:hypothetical protein